MIKLGLRRTQKQDASHSVDTTLSLGHPPLLPPLWRRIDAVRTDFEFRIRRSIFPVDQEYSILCMFRKLFCSAHSFDRICIL